MSGPSVSVVIAVRDGERTIQRAIQSVFAQVSPADELFVVDDKSSDTTRNRVQELENNDVILIKGEGRGAGAARNAGIRRARGDWVAFLDGDDYWDPAFLRLARERISRSPDAIACFGAATPIDESGNIVGSGAMPYIVTLEQLVSGRITHSTSAVLASRDLLIRCGGFCENLTRTQDIDLWWRLAASGPCVGVPQVASYYEIHPERDKAYSFNELLRIQRNYELLLTRFANSGASPNLIRSATAIRRAHIARFWLQAGWSRVARNQALESVIARPTRQGLIALTLTVVPRGVRAGLLELIQWARTLKGSTG